MVQTKRPFLSHLQTDRYFSILFGEGVLTLKKGGRLLHCVLFIWQKRIPKLGEVTVPRRVGRHSSQATLGGASPVGPQDSPWVVRGQPRANRPGMEPQAWEDCDSVVGSLRGQVPEVSEWPPPSL